MTAPMMISEHLFIRRFSVVDYDLFLVMSERVAHFNQECKDDFSLERIADVSHENNWSETSWQNARADSLAGHEATD